jgi:hypothetical protein
MGLWTGIHGGGSGRKPLQQGRDIAAGTAGFLRPVRVLDVMSFQLKAVVAAVACRGQRSMAAGKSTSPRPMLRLMSPRTASRSCTWPMRSAKRRTASTSLPPLATT